MTYTLQVVNTGGFDDLFTFQVEGNLWPVVVTPNPLGPLAPLEARWVDVVVQIPENAAGGSLDQAHITVRSYHDPTKSKEFWISTHSAYYTLFMPVVHK